MGTTRLRHIVRDWDDLSVTLVFVPDGKTLISVANVGACAWDRATGKRLPWLRGYPGTMAAQVSPDGKVLILGNRDGSLHKLEVGTGKLLQAIRPDLRPPAGFFRGMSGAICANGKCLMLSDYSERLVFIDVDAARVIRWQVHPGHGTIFPRSSLAPDGTSFVASGKDREIHLYSLPQGQQRVLMKHLYEPAPGTPPGDAMLSLRPLYLAYSPDAKMIAVGGGEFLQLFDAQNGRFLRHVSTGQGRVAFSPDGKWLVAGLSGRMRLFEVATGKQIRQFDWHAGVIRALAFSPDGRQIASAEDHTITLWDVATGRRVHPLVGHQGTVTSLAVTPDGGVLASGGNYVDPCVILWDLKTGKELHRLPQHAGDVACLAFSPDGKTLASGEGYYYTKDGVSRCIRLWDVQTGKLKKEIAAHPNKVSALAFSRDGKTLISNGGELAQRYWDVATGRPAEVTERLAPMEFQPEGERMLDSPDGRLVARWSNGLKPTVSLLEKSSGRLLHTFNRPDIGPTDSVSAVIFAPDGRSLIVGSRDTTILVWDLSPWSGSPAK
jgi:WD40 repeat protein